MRGQSAWRLRPRSASCQCSAQVDNVFSGLALHLGLPMGRASGAVVHVLVGALSFCPGAWRSSISSKLCVPGPMRHRPRATCHSRAKDTCSQAGYYFSTAADGIRGAASLRALCPRRVFACQPSQAAPFEFLWQSWKVSALVDPRMPAQLAHILVIRITS